jgi:hypothetical protein
MRSLIALALSVLFVPLSATAAGYRYTHSANVLNGQAILIKSTPGVLHTVTFNSGFFYVGEYIYLLDTNSATECSLASPPTAPLIASIAPPNNRTPVTLTFDLTTKSGLCLVHVSQSIDMTVTWN